MTIWRWTSVELINGFIKMMRRVLTSKWNASNSNHENVNDDCLQPVDRHLRCSKRCDRNILARMGWHQRLVNKGDQFYRSHFSQWSSIVKNVHYRYSSLRIFLLQFCEYIKSRWIMQIERFCSLYLCHSHENPKHIISPWAFVRNKETLFGRAWYR